jgi:hypothetical protein
VFFILPTHNQLLALEPDGNEDDGTSALLNDVQKAISESDTLLKNFDFSANQHRRGKNMSSAILFCLVWFCFFNP